MSASSPAADAARRVGVVYDHDRRDAVEAATMVRGAIDAAGAQVVDLHANDAAPPADLDLAVVVGGDGSIIRGLRRFAAAGVPVAGVNVGRLGFLAEFDAESFAEHAVAVLDRATSITDALLLDVAVRPAGGGDAEPADFAVNDVAITSGPPYRMVELAISIDGEAGPPLAGDGLIVATPVGSTAYSVSAGGPILHPAVGAIVLTPVAAHSLAFRPIVVAADVTIDLEVLEANEGTMLLRDGHAARHLAEGDVVTVRRRDPSLGRARLVDNPGTSYWRILQDKLRWAAPPTYRRPRRD